jgi:uncharacterized membrane protein YozB (DUF420 family)
MGFLGTGASVWSDALLMVEGAITVGIVVGILLIRRGRIKHHRAVMLGTLAVNAVFLVAFLVQDAVAATTTVERGLSAPMGVFVPVLVVHLAFAFSSFGVAIVAWRRAGTGHHVGADGVHTVTAAARRFHKRVARFYPWLWGATLVTGILLYNVVYVFYG